MRKAGLLRGMLLTALAVAPLLIAPSWIRGLAAEKWVEYYASLDALPRPQRASARVLVAKADIAIRSLAPLPQASGAAIRALEIGQRLQNQGHDRVSALIVYRGVRASCARVRSRILSGAGFAVIEARAAALEQAASQGSPR